MINSIYLPKQCKSWSFCTPNIAEKHKLVLRLCLCFSSDSGFSFIDLIFYFLQLINEIMPKQQADEEYNNDKELKKAHSVISSKRRQKLIELVTKQNMTIYKAAIRLKICHPTAKFILKNYRKTQEDPKIVPKTSQIHQTENLIQTNSEISQEKQRELTTVPTFPSQNNYYLHSNVEPLYISSLWNMYGIERLYYYF